MGFQLGEDHDSGMNEMNLIPLIDIMLVLMIIFLVTATVANPSIPLALPKTTADIVDPPPKAITISINEKVKWHGMLKLLVWMSYRRVSKKQQKQKQNRQYSYVLIKNQNTIQ